jgi:hypothetical protein
MTYTAPVKLSWDQAKSRENLRKHGISFEEAGELFSSGVDYLEIYDDEHSVLEDRFIAIGPLKHRLVLVVWTERDEDTIRIISARWATRREQSVYRTYMERTS